MTSYRRALYDIDVIARLRFPMPDGPHQGMEDEIEAVWNDRQAFVEASREELERQLDELMSDDGEIAREPDPLFDELCRVSHLLASLQRYRDQLIVYARTFASETIPARTIGNIANMSHSTIVRMITEESVAAVAPEASAAAYDALDDAADRLRDDPEFYLRLKAALISTEEGQDHDADQ